MKKKLLKAKTLDEINKIFDDYQIISYVERIKILEELLSSQPIHFFSEDNQFQVCHCHVRWNSNRQVFRPLQIHDPAALRYWILR